MATTGDDAVIRPLGRPGDLGWVVMAHGEVYAEEFGWDTDFEALVARIVADFAAGHDAARDAAWIAEVGGDRVGCVFVVADEDDGPGSRPRSCASCSCIPTVAVAVSAVGWSALRWASRATRATRT
jgi:hypothetical protein